MESSGQSHINYSFSSLYLPQLLASVCLSAPLWTAQPGGLLIHRKCTCDLVVIYSKCVCVCVFLFFAVKLKTFCVQAAYFHIYIINYLHFYEDFRLVYYMFIWYLIKNSKLENENMSALFVCECGRKMICFSYFWFYAQIKNRKLK